MIVLLLLLFLFFQTNYIYAQNLPPLGSNSSPNSNSPKYSYFLQGKAVSENAYKAAILLNDGVLLLRANKNEEAIAKFNEALAYDPNFPEVHHNLGVAMAKLGNVELAITELDKAVNLNPENDSSWYTLAGLYQSIGQIDNAISYYEQFLKKFPNSDMHKRISKLVAGLKNEQKNLGKSKNTQDLPPQSPTVENQNVSDTDDYLTEVTAVGVHRWPQKLIPIKVYIHSGINVPGYRDSFQSVVRQCFIDWSKASSYKIQFEFVSAPREASLECFFVDDVSKLNNPAEAGEARVTTNKTGIIKGTIKLLTKPMSPILPLTDNRMRVICFHEIGHILGLTGHTSNPKDAMFYSESFSDKYYELSGRDARTITRLYADYESR
jgi:tetratricopeptide (TPR) repeat protein